ncbi:uncharacterized protein METZ01_LOCUS110207 [marine metagenome]|uniref:Uncharacterized protein n=1 Tax=marine metagenome TaxID=408172 RepID=A0A381WZH2_9ZZZZ
MFSEKIFTWFKTDEGIFRYKRYIPGSPSGFILNYNVPDHVDWNVK